MQIQKEKTNEFTSIKKIYAVMSGKGGVGKSSVTSLIAISLRNQGYKVGILDADITGPSIPKVFGINSKRASSNGQGIIPVETSTGIKVISINLLIEEEDKPVVWRGPLIGGTVKQFYTDVNWGELDYLLIDMPPGTGDVPLTIMQSLPVDGLIIVSSPQDLVKLIVTKSINMAKTMNVPIIGIVENMSYFVCPHCNEKVNVFGESKVDTISKETGIPLIAKMPIDPDFVSLCDEGKIEIYDKYNIDFNEDFSTRIKEIIGG